MLKDILDFVQARTQLPRADALREINYAFKELWKSTDMPNSIFELTAKPAANTSIIALPWYVGQIKGVKHGGSGRVILNTPRRFYQDDTYVQSPYTWRILGTSPLYRSITNASTLTLTFKEPVTEQVIVTILGATDQGVSGREQLTFQVGDTSHESTLRFSDLETVAKSVVTLNNLFVLGPDDVELGIVPNSALEAKNKIIQIAERGCATCANCNCFDILYKLPAPLLYYDEDPVPDEEVIMAKAMEWIMLPKEGQEKTAALYGTKALNLMTAYNNNEEHPVDHKLDVAASMLEKRYSGHL